MKHILTPRRTHRERKELYVKALEDEVLRLKEVYATISQEKENLMAENNHLREAMTTQGLDLDVTGVQFSNMNLGGFNPSSGGTLDDHRTPESQPGSETFQQAIPGDQHHPETQQYAAGAGGVDVEQAGIDFVLTYDDPSWQAHPSFPPQ